MYYPKVAEELIKYALEIEEQVMSICSLKPYEINNETIAKYIEELRKYNITSMNI